MQFKHIGFNILNCSEDTKWLQSWACTWSSLTLNDKNISFCYLLEVFDDWSLQILGRTKFHISKRTCTPVSSSYYVLGWTSRMHCSMVSSIECKLNFCWFTRKLNRTPLIGLIISSQHSFILSRTHTYGLNPFATQTFSSTLKVCIDQWGPLVITESEALYENMSFRCRKIKWNRCYANAGSLSVTVIDGGLSLRERAQPLQFKMLKSRLRISNIWAK